MAEIDYTRLTSKPELGSLETPPGGRVKRLTVQELRQLKAQSHKENTFKAKLLRVISNAFKDFAALFTYNKKAKRGPSNCILYGHFPDPNSKDIVPRCRHCHIEIVSVEQLRAKI